MNDIISQLECTIAQRLASGDATSYIASLKQKGTAKIAQKIGEEGVECALALVQQHHEDIISESADLLFHLLIGLHHSGCNWNEVLAELSRREGVSGITEKNQRSS